MAMDTMPGSDDDLFQEHKRTYGAFIKFSIYTTAAVVVVLILMAIFLL